MKRYVYLLGAGASCEAIPVLSDFNSKMISVLNDLFDASALELFSGYSIVGSSTASNVNDELMNSMLSSKPHLDWFKSEVNKHKSIDTLAKRLFLTGDNNNLKRLKALISLFLFWHQCPNNYDKRYDSFLATVLEKNKDILSLPKNINFISWNYDFQLELTLSHYYNLTKFSEINDQINKPSEPNNPFIVKLNGSSGHYYEEDKLKFLIDDLKFAKENENNVVQVLERFEMLASNTNFKSLINFAWEENQLSQNLVSQAKQLISNADILIIIGYSFPIFNKMIDEEIFNGLKEHKAPKRAKIFIQDPNANEVKNRLLNYFPLIKKLTSDHTTSDSPMKIFTDLNVNQFLAPDDLN